MSIFNVFTLMGGIAMFLYGMDLMGKALEQTAGSKLQGILSKMTASPVRGLLLGMVITAVIQSSGATTVMAVGFVNSGLMELHQAIGIIMGSNVGTTVTSWILSLSGLQGDSFFIQLLKPTSFSPLLAFIGILLYMGKSEKRKGIGTILIGFAVLMTGMTTMSSAVAPLQNETWFTNLFVRFSNPILGVLVGALVTGIIQSSSASVGILQALSATGVITYGSNVKEVTTQVSEGSVDCGIVYCTDAFSAGLTVIDGASKDMGGQVIYPAAVLKTAKNPDAAKAFLDYLTGSEAMAIFEAVGFSPVA